MPALADAPAPAPSRWRDLRKRTLSAAVLAPLVLLCIWYGGRAFELLLIAAAVGMAWEWVRLCGYATQGLPGLAVLVSVFGGVSAVAFGSPSIGLAILAAGTAIAAAAGRGGPKPALLPWGVLYTGLGSVALLSLRVDAVVGLTDTLFLLLVVWGSDIGAYMIGRLVGGPKLAPSISPGKTRSGAVGGLIGAVAAGVAVAMFTRHLDAPMRVAAVAAVLGVVAQAGDLLESLLKRHCGVKDSGNLIPGHGGLLDRLDALLIAAPVAALLALCAGRGVVLWQ